MDNTSKASTACTIVVYHYVRDKATYPGIIGLTVDKFIRQIDYLRNNYSIISLSDFVEYVNHNKVIPDKSCILTFDDGLKEHYTNVFPILKKYRLPGVFFPITDSIVSNRVAPVHQIHYLLAKLGAEKLASEFKGILKQRSLQEFAKYKEAMDTSSKSSSLHPFDTGLVALLKHTLTFIIDRQICSEVLEVLFRKHFDNLQQFARELYLSAEDIAGMSNHGMEIGVHTHTHPVLARLNDEDQFKEISISKGILSDMSNKPIQTFSYPYGRPETFNEATINIVKSLGFSCAVTVSQGVNYLTENLFLLKRMDTNDFPT